MPLVFADRVKESSTTTGTGAFTLDGAVNSSFRAFSSVCSVADTCYYAITAVDGAGAPTGAWEVGRGTYSAADTLTRTTVLASSNAGAAVDFAAGDKHVWIDLAAAAVYVSPLTTKGDLLAFSTAHERLAVGTDGHYLVADSTQALGVKWAAFAPAGSDKEVQFNDGGALGAAPEFTFDKTTDTLTLGVGSEFGTLTAYIRGANGLTSGHEGANLVIAPGDGHSSGGGSGNLTITNGKPGSAGGSGTILIQPNQLPGASNNGGSVSVKGGDDSSGGPGSLTLSAGSSLSSGTGAVATLSGGNGANGGGKVTVKGGDHTASTTGITGAQVEIKGGTANRTTIAGTATGGPVNITGGAATGSTNLGAGGAVNISGGTAAGSGAGGSVTLTGGVPTAGAGGSVSITGSAGVGTNKNGGSVNITPGAATGTGTPGNVVLNNSGAALATTAIGGFPCVPTCAGTPTGTPAGVPTGTVAMVVDTTNSILYFYIGGAWKGAALT